ncbi:MAG: MoxR family ATPase [Deltaproteobacteria bacterium]|nr:MoxR family ATPase [Deltaproteobacteria bacterium]
MTASGPIDPRTLAQISERCEQVIAEVQAVYVGPRAIPEILLVTLLARGHVLLEGVPGVAKTTLCKAFAGTLGCHFRRIQFTPDLLPADITGTYVFTPSNGQFQLREGPVFTNVLLGDEINRAPAKTQSALLEAMQEHQTTIEGDSRPLPSPFIVLATQNPVEQAGTYPLPEAQIDRFLARIVIGYPSPREEKGVLKRFLEGAPEARKILDPGQILTMQQLVRQVHVEEEVLDYVVRMAVYTRQQARVLLGVSPRASLALVSAARARALIAGRAYVLPDDVKALAVHVLAHRLVLTPEAEMEGASREQLIQKALEQVPHRS